MRPVRGPSFAARLIAVLVAVLVLGSSSPAGAEAEGATSYQPPLAGPVVDTFRPPASGFGAGNRGIDYAAAVGDAVRAAAGGEVVFAGTVGRGRHVTVLHPDGLRTTYSFLATVSVRRGDRVAQGDEVGTAGPTLHFGARAGERYVDPALLFSGAAPEVHLVPLELRSPGTEAEERNFIERGLQWAGDTAEEVVAWASDRLDELTEAIGDLTEAELQRLLDELRARAAQGQALLQYAEQYLNPLSYLQLYEDIQRFVEAQEGCTPATQAPPPPPEGERIAVLVAGFGSSGEGAAVQEVDTDALGYEPSNVVQFSYAGGAVPGRGDLDVSRNDYDPADANQDLRDSGRNLHDLLAEIREAHPGVSVDVIAHSQGGVVARLALGDEDDRGDPDLPEIANLVTLGSPHDGADVATASAAIAPTTAGGYIEDGLALATDGAVDTGSVAIQQLSEGSSFWNDMEDRPLPFGADVTSIAARGDLTVAAVHSSLEGATNAAVPVEGLSAHDQLPGSAEATREMQLALGGLGPTCRDVVPDLALAAAISTGEDFLGVAATVAAIRSDRGRRPSSRPAPHTNRPRPTTEEP